jgi:hypothetical protein
MLPTPGIPSDALPGLLFNQAMSPARSSAGMEGRAMINCGKLAISEIGSKSFKQ